MSQEFDFDRYWLDKFSRCLEEQAGTEVRTVIMQGSEALSRNSDRQEIAAWTRSALDRLESLIDESEKKAIMTGCACQYSKSDLQDIQQRYAETQDLNIVHSMLQQRFENFLRESLELENSMVNEIINRGWGLAGTIDGNTIIATKIPKSGLLVEYLNESDPQKRRQYYCHCPRVREIVKYGETLPRTYCYCGAGFYKGIWEEILQKPVEVEVLESVLDGGEVCKIAIHLPAP
jgi:predicted hydrocarbon binding protein